MATPVSRMYGSFSGLDYASAKIDIMRSPDAKNVWKNYNNANGINIETRPNISKIANFEGERVNSFYLYDVVGIIQRTEAILHCGTNLYKWDNYPNTPVEKTLLFEDLHNNKSTMFVFENDLFIKDGINYIEYNGERAKIVEGTIPLTSILRVPSGGGTFYQQVNTLQSKRINGFIGDGKSVEYHLDATELDDVPVKVVIGNDEYIDGVDFNVNLSKGIVTFNEAPVEAVDQQSNVMITFSKTTESHISRIQRCSLMTFFDNRIFVSGNPNYPNNIFWTELGDARYFGDLNYANEGNDLEPVKALIPSNNALWVLKEPNQANTTAFYHTPTIDDTFGKVYPTSNSSISTGCISTGINFGDDVVFFSENGMEAITGNITSENFLSHRSSLIDNVFTNEEKYKEMQIAEYDNYLLCLVGNKVYLADNKQKFQYDDNHWEYEWYMWEIDQNITKIETMRDKLYFYDETGGIYAFGGEETFESYWSTPKDDLTSTIYLKTTSKRGGVAQFIPMNNEEIELSVSINNQDYESLGMLNDDEGYAVYNIKKKKFKTIQLKFSSNKPFCLINCTIQGYIGGYVKR